MTRQRGVSGKDFACSRKWKGRLIDAINELMVEHDVDAGALLGIGHANDEQFAVGSCQDGNAIKDRSRKR